MAGAAETVADGGGRGTEFSRDQQSLLIGINMMLLLRMTPSMEWPKVSSEEKYGVTKPDCLETEEDEHC